MTRDLVARLRNRAALIDKRRSVEWDFSSPLASFTFDDFPCSAYEVGARILREKAQAKATYYVSGCFIGRTIDGIKFYDEGHLNALEAEGHEIGCHGFEHVKFGEHGRRFAQRNCDDNAAFVRDVVGSHVKMTSFAYPYGDTSLSVKASLAKKFPFCRGVRQELNSCKVDRSQISIISLEIRHAEQVNLKSIIAEAIANKSWIVFLTHDVCENPSPYGSTPAMIENAIDAVKAAGIEIMPLTQAAMYGLKKPKTVVSSPELWVPSSTALYS